MLKENGGKKTDAERTRMQKWQNPGSRQNASMGHLLTYCRQGNFDSRQNTCTRYLLTYCTLGSSKF